MGSGASVENDAVASALVDEWRNTKYIEFLKEMHKKAPTRMRSIINYSHVTVEMVEQNKDLPWDCIAISKCPHLVDLIRKYPDRPWDLFEVSQNAGLTMDIVSNNPNINWNLRKLSMHLFEYDIRDFATNLKTKLVIAFIHEQSAKHFCNNQMEHMFADNYIVSHIIRFVG